MFRIDSSPEEVLKGINTLRYITQVVREMKADADAHLVGWLEAHGGELEDGDTRWYVGNKTREKCRSLGTAFESLVDATSGDIDRIVSVLSSNAIKPGAAESELGKEWRALHFERTIEREPKTGKPKRTIKTASKKFQLPSRN